MSILRPSLPPPPPIGHTAAARAIPVPAWDESSSLRARELSTSYPAVPCQVHFCLQDKFGFPLYFCSPRSYSIVRHGYTADIKSHQEQWHVSIFFVRFPTPHPLQSATLPPRKISSVRTWDVSATSSSLRSRELSTSYSVIYYVFLP